MKRLQTISLLTHSAALLVANLVFAAAPNPLTPGKTANIDLRKSVRTGVARENAERWVPMKFSGASSSPKGLPLKRSSKRVSIRPTSAHQGHFYTVTVAQVSKKQRNVRGPNRRFKWVDVYNRFGKLVTRTDSKKVPFFVDILPLAPVSISVGAIRTIPLPAPHLKWKVRRKSYRACEARLGTNGGLFLKGLKEGTSNVAIEARHKSKTFVVPLRVTVSGRSAHELQIFAGETTLLDPKNIPALSGLSEPTIKQVETGSGEFLDATSDRHKKSITLTGISPGNAEVSVLYEGLKGSTKTERSVVLSVQVLSGDSWDAGQRQPAILFSGDGYLSFPYVPFDEFQEFTFEAWVYGWDGLVFSQGRAGDPENEIWLRSKRTHHPMVFWEYGRGSNVKGPEKERPVDATRWKHLAFTFRRKVLRVHIDGRVVATLRNVKGFGPLTKNRPFHVGCHVSKKGKIIGHATGLLRSLRISKVARYTSTKFRPEAEWQPDDKTELLIDATDFKDPLPDRSARQRNGHGSNVRAVTLRHSAAD